MNIAETINELSVEMPKQFNKKKYLIEMVPFSMSSISKQWIGSSISTEIINYIKDNNYDLSLCVKLLNTLLAYLSIGEIKTMYNVETLMMNELKKQISQATVEEGDETIFKELALDLHKIAIKNKFPQTSVVRNFIMKAPSASSNPLHSDPYKFIYSTESSSLGKKYILLMLEGLTLTKSKVPSMINNVSYDIFSLKIVMNKIAETKEETNSDSKETLKSKYPSDNAINTSVIKEYEQQLGVPLSQIYPRKYYSGADAYIYINNIPIGEIVAISYELNEVNVPIYGYASYTFDTVAHGQRLVTGTFRINFIEEFYLKAILTQLSKNKTNSSNPKSPYKNNSSGTPISKQDLIAALGRQDFDKIKEIAEQYEDYLWGKDTNWMLNRYEQPYFADQASLLTKNGFDVIITWGNELSMIAGVTQDIAELPGTVTVINNVHLMGVSKITQPTGETIYEEYKFIARDLNNTLATEEEVINWKTSQSKPSTTSSDVITATMKLIKQAINDIVWYKKLYENGTEGEKAFAADNAKVYYQKLRDLDESTIADALQLLNYNDSLVYYTNWKKGAGFPA